MCSLLRSEDFESSQIYTLESVLKCPPKQLIQWLRILSISFLQEVRLIFPNSQRINRGNYEINQLVSACQANDVTDLIILSEHRGTPGESLLY